ncbi:unnamed protein product [Trichobilharzia szidati]|nr:unnamed protein product [Trichobilharzia szidati]
MDSSRILSSEMMTTTTISGCMGNKQSLKLPSTDMNVENNFKSLDIYTLIEQISIENLWLAHQLVNSEHGSVKDAQTGNTLLHYLILSASKLAAKQHNNNSGSSIDLSDDENLYPEWASAIVGLVYRLVIHGRCSINAQNNMGNTPLHLVCLLPYTEFLTVHLIRLGADPEIKNNCGLHIYYNCEERRAWLVKNLPGLNCGIWNAIRREDLSKVDYYLSCWCRTVANQPSGKSLFECAMSTGNYELVRHIDQARNTNELIAATLALDLNYMESLLSTKIEKERCQVNKCDVTFDPPRPLIAELKMLYGSEANEAVELLKKYGTSDELLYHEAVKQKKMAFINSSFYLQVKTARTMLDLNKAWELIDQPSFQPKLRRHTDQATYLHFLVERYKSLRCQPNLQRGLIRLMAKLAISGVDLQARDSSGNTALLYAAKTSHVVNEDVTELAEEPVSEPCDEEENEEVDKDVQENVQNNEEETGSSEHRPDSVTEIDKTKVGEDLTDVGNVDNKTDVIGSEEVSVENTSDQSNTSTPILCRSATEEIKEPSNLYMKIPHFSDQRLISVLIQLGLDSSIPCNDGYSVYHENYIPKGVYTIARNIQTSLLKCSIKQSKGMIDHPGIWPIVDRLVYSIQHNKSNDIINYFYTELENTIKANLIWLKAKRSGLTVIEWIKSLWSHQNHCEKSTELMSTKVINMLQRYISLTDFAVYALAGDIKQMKQCLETEPFGPVAFWSFKEFVSLQHTYEVIKEAPIHLRDSNGSSLFHYAANLFRVIHPEDVNGFHWASLILATVLKRGVKIYYRDVWGRTGRDLLDKKTQKLLYKDSDFDEKEESFRPFEEKGPDPFDLYEIIDSDSGNVLTAEQLIDRQITLQVSANHLHSIEELILYGYNYLHLANSGPPKYKSARNIAECKEYSEMLTLYDTADQYRLEMSNVHKTVLTGDYHHFLQLVNMKKVIMSRDWRERSLLHLAVLYRRTDFVLQLIELYPELVNYQDCLGRTPLHYAICLNDNRRLFLKIVAKSGLVNKQTKDLRNVSINQYGELYEKNIPEYRNLINSEKSCILLEPNWPDQRIIISLTIEPNNESVIEKEEDSSSQNNNAKLTNEQIEEIDNSLLFPIPGAFNARELKRINSAFHWKQRA